MSIASSAGRIGESISSGGTSTWLRLALRSGLAARVLTLAVVAGAMVAPFLATMILDPHALDSLQADVPPLLMLSPILPALLAIDIGMRETMPAPEALRVIVPAIGYGLLAVALWIAVEVRCIQARRLLAARRANLLARLAPAAAPAAADPSHAPAPTSAPDGAPAP